MAERRFSPAGMRVMYAILLLLLCGAAWGQNAVVSGRVTDTSGGVVPVRTRCVEGPYPHSVIADSPSALCARRPRITHAGTGKNEGLTLCMSIAVSKRTRTSSAGPDQSPVRKPLYCCLETARDITNANLPPSRTYCSTHRATNSADRS